jgi:hypothetical protein
MRASTKSCCSPRYAASRRKPIPPDRPQNRNYTARPIICPTNHLPDQSFARPIICPTNHLPDRLFIYGTDHLRDRSFTGPIVCCVDRLFRWALLRLLGGANGGDDGGAGKQGATGSAEISVGAGTRRIAKAGQFRGLAPSLAAESRELEEVGNARTDSTPLRYPVLLGAAWVLLSAGCDAANGHTRYESDCADRRVARP